MAQDDYFYEIQLTNKQLVFYFMALATGLIMSFLAGIMVGRGVDDRGVEASSRGAGSQEERVVAEEKSRVTPPTPTSLTYAQRLDSEKTEEALEKVKPQAAPSARAAAAGETKPPAPAKDAAAGRETAAKPSPRPAPADTGSPAAKAAASSAAEKPQGTKGTASPAPAVASGTTAPPALSPSNGQAAPAAGAGAGGFSIQVGAFRDRAAADSIVARLKGKGFGAFVVAPGSPEGLFNVRVGPFTQRADAEKAQTKLRDEEKLKPFLVKQ